MNVDRRPNPFLLFPEEIWEIFLEKLEDSMDIQNVFQAYPQMQGYVLKNKFRWLLEQVIPYIHPWLNPNALLTCRRVCKKWCHGVDIYLDNHPIRRALHPDIQMTCQVWFAAASQANYNPELRNYFDNGLDGGGKIEVLTEFLIDLDKHPHGRSPFVGRSIKLDDEGLFQMSDGLVNTFWDGAIDLVRKFGGHIWFLEIGAGYPDPRRFCTQFLDILYFVPNLKSIQINNCQRVEEAAKECSGLWREFLPPLTHLESIYCTDSRSSATLINALITYYSRNLTRLCIESCHWKSDYSQLFPKLTQLRLSGIKSHEQSKLTQLLSSLNAPKLTSLHLELDNGLLTIVSRDRIISWLQTFPLIQSFELQMHYGRFSSNEKDLSFPINSLKSLIIRQDNFQVSPSIMQCFPSLAYLKICGLMENPEFENRILYNQRIWSVLPKLKEITVANKLKTRCVSRARYEWSRRED